MKKKILSVLLSALLIFSCTNAAYGYEIEKPDCRAAIIMDQATGDVLYEYNSSESLPMASVTKLMTYYVFMEYATEEGMDFEQTVRVNTGGWNLSPGASVIGLKDGEELTIYQLIQGTLIVSANDFATGLKDVYELNGGSIVDEMNRKAQEMGLKNTFFVNVTGLTGDTEKDTNFSSARDIALLCKAIIDEFPETLQITKRKSFDYNGKTFSTTNGLLNIDSDVDGMKTGYTEAAGYCLAATKIIQPSDNNNGQYRAISVALGCKTDKGRVEESEKLLDGAREGFVNERAVEANQEFTQENAFYKGGTIGAVTNEDTFFLHNVDDDLNIEAQFKDKLTKKITKGDEIGTLTITNPKDGKSVSVPLYAADDYNTVNIFVKLFLVIKDFFSNLF